MSYFSSFPNLKTERTSLRQLRRKDAEDLYYLRTDDRVYTYLDRETYHTIDQAYEFIHNINAGVSSGNWIMWAIVLQKTGRVVGTVCLWKFDFLERKAEIGYELHPDYQGKGIMTEVVNRIIHYGFSNLKLETIEAVTNALNTKSLNLLETQQFDRVRIFHEIDSRGRSVNMAVYRLRQQSFRRVKD
ncbi:GNAT family N-acetyltransferase [Halobacillus rhizosphaerae]|uniref:GNAT family N-acetyltransferase n=1 Tax=Halobacillus rhizosphaerae TaxID=3064889 RepID=UPI00398B6AC6